MRGILLFLLLASPAFGQATYTAASCVYNDVNACINSGSGSCSPSTHTAINGDIINIPAGTCPWASTLTINAAITLQGAGAETSSSWNGTNNTLIGTDQTIINPQTTGGASTIIVNTTSGNPEVRITGIAFLETPSSSNSGSGIIHYNGNANNIRFDHNHVFTRVSKSVVLTGSMVGVADHDFMDELVLTFDFSAYNGANWNNCGTDPNGYGDCSFADGDHWGTNQFFYIEDSYFNGVNGVNSGYVTDCVDGGRFVIRNSTGVNMQGAASHGSTSTSRGCRATEIYNTNFSYSPSHACCIGHPNSGTMIAWGNITTGMGNIADAQMERILSNEGRDSEELGEPPNGWGYCGTKFNTGTATATASSTAVSGSGFQTTWPAPFNMYIPGANCAGSFGTHGDVCKVSSVANSTALTLAQVANTSVSGVTFMVGSPWDGSILVTGYPCFDAPSRGVGDLLNGANFPARANTVTSTQSWPHQALSPMYFFANNWTPTGTGGQGIFFDGTGVLADNRDYFLQYGTGGEPGSNCTTSPCNITAGINQTNRAPVNGTDLCPVNNDPATGTPVSGVGWWNPASSTLYACGSTANTWVAIYTPFTYPHPLTAASGGAFSCSPSTILFGAVNQNSGTLGESTTCTNTTASTVTLTGGNITSTGGYASQFSIGTVSCGSISSATIAPGANCTIFIQFTPTFGIGTTATGQFNLDFSGVTGSPIAVALNGTIINGIPGASIPSFAIQYDGPVPFSGISSPKGWKGFDEAMLK